MAGVMKRDYALNHLSRPAYHSMQHPSGQGKTADALRHSENDARRLRFAPILEQQFKQERVRELTETCWQIILPVCGIVVGFALFDLMKLGYEALRFELVIRLGVQVPVLICAGLLLRSARFGALAPSVVVTAVLVLGCGNILVGLLDQSGGQPLPTHAGLMLITVGIYLLLGLRLPQAVTTALVLSLVWVMTMIAAGRYGSELVEGGMFLVAANVVGLTAGYRQEVSQRLGFLRERMQAFAGEHDALTGLYSRPAGEDRLRTLLRLGLRERRPLGAALMAIDALRELDAQRGAEAVDHVVKAVAREVEGMARRPLDFAAAMGGGRFLLVLADVGRDEFERLLEIARQQVVALSLPHPGSPAATYVTATAAGLWVGRDWSMTADEVIEALEACLERVRNTGLNRSDVQVWRGNDDTTSAPVLKLFGRDGSSA